MTQQLYPGQGWVADPSLQIFRALKKTAIVLMLLFRLDKPVGEGEIARMLDIHPETMRTYLRSLARLGMVTRTHRYQGWTLTGGGRQMILGESNNEWPGGQGPIKQTEKIKASAENPRSLPAAAASLILSLKEENDEAAAEAEASAENPRWSARISRSLFSRRVRIIKKEDRIAEGRPRSDPMVQANLEAFRSIGLVKNAFVLEICKMDHVTPNYILGQKKRLEAERRYSGGLLLTVVRCNDYLPEKHIPREEPDPPQTPPKGGENPRFFEPETELEEERVGEHKSGRENAPWPTPEIESDPSIHEPLLRGGMTAMRAWSAATAQLQMDMPRGAYDPWVRGLVLLSAKDGIFVIGASNDYARDWLESRLSSTVRRLLTGICNRSVEVKFVNVNELKVED